MKLTPNFYRDRVCLNVLAGSKDNAREIYVAAEGIVPLETAIALLKDMGGSSIKYFPMGGLKHRAEFEAVAKACAEHDFWLEPTGGIDLENYSEILKIALDAGVSKIIPHIYSSIIDKASGDTRPEDVRTLLAMTKKLVK